MTTVTLEQLTTSTVDGSGVFDKLMQAVEAHIDQEFKKNRIKGPEYATVYLGALQSTLDQSIRFLLDKDEAALKAKQIELMDAQIAEVNARISLLQQQATNAGKEGALLDKQVLKLDSDILLTDAQKDKVDAEILLLGKQELKSAAETALLEQKRDTELAQVDGTGVSPDSVIGRQMTLYKNQAEGYLRDAEQKATKMMLDTWNVRMTADPNITDHNAINKLEDATIGKAVTSLLQGIGITNP